MKFLVDLPLGGLAKWLRFCGFDAESRRLAGDLPPPETGTCILTRQESLKRLDRPDLLLVNSETPEEQLREVFHHLNISAPQLQPLSRCSRCNEPLAPIPREQAQG